LSLFSQRNSKSLNPAHKPGRTCLPFASTWVHSRFLVGSGFSFFVLSYYVSLRAEFCVVMSITISAQKRCSIRLYLQLSCLIYVICVCYTKNEKPDPTKNREWTQVLAKGKQVLPFIRYSLCYSYQI
jgi:hypothetical protein